MENLKNNIKITSVIIGTLIGAGFASGKEIYLFFSQYGICGIFSLFFSNFLFCIIIYKTLRITHVYNINNFSEFLELLFGKNKFKKIIK